MLSADVSYTFGQFDTLVNGVTQQTQTHTAFSVHVWVQNGRHRLSISHFSSFHLIGAQTVWRDLPLPFRNWLLEHRNLFFLVLYSTFPFFVVLQREPHTPISPAHSVNFIWKLLQHSKLCTICVGETRWVLENKTIAHRNRTKKKLRPVWICGWLWYQRGYELRQEERANYKNRKKVRKEHGAHTVIRSLVCMSFSLI